MAKSADVDIEYDASQVRVNFSEDEASSEARDFTPIPGGKYHCAITEIETKFSNSEKNKGKPYWAVTLVVQNGPYADRKLWANVMLFDGALYSLAQLMKAIDRGDVLKTGKVPAPEELLGQQLMANVSKMRDKFREDREDDGEKYFKNEVRGFAALSDTVAAGNGGGSLLP